MDNLLRELIEAIKNLAPEVWAIYVRQNSVYIFSDIFWSIACFIGALYLWKKGMFIRERDDYDDEMIAWLFWALAICLLLIGLICTCYAIMRAINPEYYAIQMLLHGNE